MVGIVIQTADPEVYKPLLDITATASRRFCDIHQFRYLPFVGIKRGVYPWHAAFNRIVILSDLLRQGYAGWAIYLDADAYPFDLHFDVATYLTNNRGWGIIAASGGVANFTPGSGVLVMNFAQTAVQQVIRDWQHSFDQAWPDSRLNEAPDWVGDGDQDLLHQVLQQRGDAQSLVKIESFAVMGWPESRLFRQIRRDFGGFDVRCKIARKGVATALLNANVSLY